MPDRADVRVDGRELRGLRFEIGQRGEDLTGRDEATLANTGEQRGNVVGHGTDGIVGRVDTPGRDRVHRCERSLRLRSVDIRIGFGHHGVLLLRHARDPRYQLSGCLFRSLPLALGPTADEFVEQDLHRRGTVVT